MTARVDYTLVMLWVAALTVGLVMVASSTLPKSAPGTDIGFFVIRHLLYLSAGLALFAFCAVTPLKLWNYAYQLALLTAVALCVVVLIPGIGVLVNGARRWIGLGAFSLQPSEIAKLLLVIYLAGYLSRHQEEIRSNVVAALRPVLLIGVVCGLILLQPEFGAVVVIAAITAGMLFIGGARLRHFLLILLAAATALALLSLLQPYRVQRLVTFLDPWSEAFGSGYQLTQALIAFGRGELFGLGLGEGIQKLFYLPEAHNDFIFAVIVEELGLAGGVAVFGVLILIALRIMRIGHDALREERGFAGYLCYGCALLIGTQCLINVGVNTGMLPTKGLTLPFISYGGNSLMVCCAAMGLALRAHLEQGRAAR
jgi:cell division protein FtsW